MGERRRRRTQFFLSNPLCCFCGGENPATTEDHQPARTLFKGRIWPEGFVFPACGKCNAVSRVSEKVVSLLLHGEGDSDDRGDYQKLVRSLSGEFPDLIKSMLPNSANEIRGVLRNKGIIKPKGVQLREIPIVNLDRKFWTPHFEIFSRKILLALHYQCFGQPLSSNGRIIFWIHTNVDMAAGLFPEDVLEMAEKIALPERQRKMLGEQFAIRWNVVPEHKTAIFVVLFHSRLVVSGVTTETPEIFSQANREKMLPPWTWTET